MTTNKNTSNAKGSNGTTDLKSVASSTSGEMGFKEYESKVYELIAVMEAQHLTGCELSFKDGWQFKLEHPKRQKILLAGGNPYPKKTITP